MPKFSPNAPEERLKTDARTIYWKGSFMSNILLVTSSPRGGQSHSSRVASNLVDRLLEADPEATVTHRDLHANPMPHIGEAFAIGSRKPAEARTAAEDEVVAISDAAVDELLAADTIVVATGLINFGISSTLKSWVDNIARAGRTFRYTEAGPEGLAKGKKAYLVVASGGVYSEGPAAAFDHADPYLRTVFGFLGITDIETIRIEGVAFGPEAEEKALAAALDRTGELALAA